MTEEVRKLVNALREDAEWAHANEWETPITLGDNLDTAADLIESLSVQLDQVTRERDALLDEVKGDCYICTNYKDCTSNLCVSHRATSRECAGCKCRDCIYDSEWQWVGVEVE